MQRYFVREQYWENGIVHIEGNDAHHIQRVMRYKIGDQIICVQSGKKAYVCRIEAMTKKNVKVIIEEELEENRELPLHVTIAQAIPTGNKLDFILQKGTELGATQFMLYNSERATAKWDDKKAQQKRPRLETIVKEASEQSARLLIPEILFPLTLESVFAQKSDFTHVAFAYEEEAKKEHYTSIATFLHDVNEYDKLLICIGPEGGFSKNEVAAFQSEQFRPIRLGKRILRTETAALYTLASISYQFEEIVK